MFTWSCAASSPVHQHSPGKPPTALRAVSATPLTFWVVLKWMVAGEKGQRCCYCSTKACGHIKSLSSGRARGKLANILRLSQHCPMKSDWLHTSQSVCVHVFHHLCVPERDGRKEIAFPGDNEITLGSFGIIGKVAAKKMPGWGSWRRRCGHRSSVREQEGSRVLLYPGGGGVLIMNGRKQQDRRKRKPVCCLKSLLSLSLPLCLCLLSPLSPSRRN